MRVHAAIGVSAINTSIVMDPRLANPCHIHHTLHTYHAILWSASGAPQASRPDRFMNFVTAVSCCDSQSADLCAGFVPALGLLIMKFRLDGIILKFILTHACSALWPVSLLTRLSYYVSPAESVPSPKCPIPSFDCRKSKCRKDVNFAASLRHHRESQGL